MLRRAFIIRNFRSYSKYQVQSSVSVCCGNRNDFKPVAASRPVHHLLYPQCCCRSLRTSLLHSSCQLWQQTSEKAEKEEFDFQAETKMLLDIVARSLYSDKEIFIRELISNASDAVHKVKYMLLKGEKLENADDEMKINITTDKYNKTITIEDLGIGMTKQELVDNLGTIAKSGSKEFLQQFQEGSQSRDIIGQFGVGFYSAFMVSEKVEVITRSRIPGSPGLRWTSDGLGTFTVELVEKANFGIKITCHLKLADREFSDEDTVKNIIRKYSSFVGTTINVNDTKANTIEPLWIKEPREISPEEHQEFYRFIGSSYDKPRFILHYQTDAPINLRCLLYFPEGKPGLFELHRERETGVALYCRRILIQTKVQSLLPQWLRFLKGVVDSEDIPLNLSREMLQDSAVIRRLKTVIQNRVIRFLAEKAQKDPENYSEFFKDYGIFIKEGILTAQEQVEKEEIAKLVVYESSHKKPGERTSLAAYIGRMPPDQQNIYYLCAPSRELAESSPYFESLKQAGNEVLFCYESYDEVVLMQLRQFNLKNITSVEKEIRQNKQEVNYDDSQTGLKRSETNDLMDWMKSTLAGKCYGIRSTGHLHNHPCLITVEEMGAARHFVRTQFTKMSEDSRYSLLQPQLEINPRHPIIMKLNHLRTSNPRLAELLTKQLFNNAMVTAGLVEDPQTVLSSMNELLELALEKH